MMRAGTAGNESSGSDMNLGGGDYLIIAAVAIGVAILNSFADGIIDAVFDFAEGEDGN